MIISTTLTFNQNITTDAPIVEIEASKTTVTEGQDSLLLTCEVDANPPATIEWIKNLNTDDEEVIGRNTFKTKLVK